jgi:methionyl-tRNA formyltransferase
MVDKNIRVLYLGQKWLGEKCFDLLNGLQKDLLQICGVTSNADEKMWWRSNRIFQKCKSNGIPFIANNKRNNDAIKKMVIDCNVNTILCVQHPWILPEETLSLVNYRVFNLHNAKLPDYKGHNTCNHAILNRERYYTSTIHWMVADVDTGPIAFEETIEIDPNDTARSLYERAIGSGVNIFEKLIEHLILEKPIPRKPITGEGFYFSRNSLDTLREVKNVCDLEEVDRKVKALYFPPFEPAYYLLEGEKYYLVPRNYSIYAKEYRQGSF